MDLGIAGKWALVCGASKGLGYGCASALVQEGVNVVIVARDAPKLRQAADSLLALPWTRGEAQVLQVAADITAAEGRTRVFSLRQDYDIVITNAGGPPPGDFHDWTRETWIKAIEANMLTPIELMKKTVDGMAARGFGRVVNITSSAVKAPIDILGLSNGARSGLTGFVAGLARSPALARAGVTINNVLPGSFDTDRLRSAMAGNSALFGGKTYEEVVASKVKTIPAQRFGSPHEFGALCAFLCSTQAGYITGQNLLIDGGAYPGTF
jgi:3-oxoacyl-[acyl-carrier protein] reductase